jgi:hypothetical protein
VPPSPRCASPFCRSAFIEIDRLLLALEDSALRPVGLSGRRWRACALATVRRSNCTCSFPAYSFHESTNCEMRSGRCQAGPFRTCQVDRVRQSPQTMMYGFFHKELIHLIALTRLASLLFPPAFVCRLPRPTPVARLLGHTAFTVLEVLFGSPTTDRASLPISLSLIGSLTPHTAGTLPVLLRSRIVLPYRAIRKHLGAVGE